jgi:hypothetical protein
LPMTLQVVHCFLLFVLLINEQPLRSQEGSRFAEVLLPPSNLCHHGYLKDSLSQTTMSSVASSWEVIIMLFRTSGRCLSPVSLNKRVCSRELPV